MSENAQIQLWVSTTAEAGIRLYAPRFHDRGTKFNALSHDGIFVDGHHMVLK
jgi:hypothetical protein